MGTSSKETKLHTTVRKAKHTTIYCSTAPDPIWPHSFFFTLTSDNQLANPSAGLLAAQATPNTHQGQHARTPSARHMACNHTWHANDPRTNSRYIYIYMYIYIHTVTMMHMHMHDVTQNVMLNVRRHMRTLMHVNVCPCSCSCMLACAHAHAHDPHVYTLQSQTQHLFISAEASRITCFKPAWATQPSWV